MKLYRSKSPLLPRLVEDVLMECGRGQARLQWQGTIIPLRLTSRGVQEFEAAKERGHCLGQQRVGGLFSAYGYCCEINRRPKVKVKLTGEYAKVQLHVVPRSRPLCSHQQERIIAEALSIDDRGCLARRWLISSSFFEVKRIPTERAGDLALAISQIVREACPACVPVVEVPSGDQEGGR